MSEPARGFAEQEFVSRTRAAQALMAEANLSALLLTTEPEIRYYTGFLTQFWESPTRPWFVVLPAQGDPIAVIPSIGAFLMGQTWIDDIRTWQAPNYEDDGLGLLTETLREVTQKDGVIGIADQMESHVRMPLGSLRMLEKAVAPRMVAGDAGITRQLRLKKSEREIEKIGFAAKIADRAFGRVSEIAACDVPLSEVFRSFQALCLEEGADWIPYLAGAAGSGGYEDVISPANQTPLAEGDVLMLDTGLAWDGYFCDFDRNFSLGRPIPQVQNAHARLIDATQAAAEIARPGVLVSELFETMHRIVNPRGQDMDAGRYGHGLGMQLTEWPSIIPQDHTVLVSGMVLTLEPSIVLEPGKLMVHEENIVIRDGGAEFLSEKQDREIRVL